MLQCSFPAHSLSHFPCTDQRNCLTKTFTCHIVSSYESRPVTLQMILDPLAFLFYIIGISIKSHESYPSDRSFISVTKKLKIIQNDNYS